MRKATLFFCAFLLAVIAWAQPARYVVLVTIDGFRPDFYLDPSWGTPNLKLMKDSGACARGVNSVFPFVTYPSHSSIITGVAPAYGRSCRKSHRHRRIDA